MFEAHPELGCQVVLVNKTHKSASLVPWLQARAAAIQHLDTGSSAADIIKYLQALVLSCSTLNCIRIKVTGTKVEGRLVLHCLTNFASLSSCSLKFDDFYATPDLSPLSGLQKLSHLSLDNGSIGNLPAIGSLTHLELCVVKGRTGYCSFASTLGKLRVESCDLEGLHPRGLLGFTSLQSLQLHDWCLITADELNWADDCDFDMYSHTPGMPLDMSPFVSLTCVQLFYPMNARYPVGKGEQLDFTGISTLPNLQSLKIAAPSPIIFDHTYEKLTRLTSLYISGIKCGQDFSAFALDWQVLQALRQLEITGSFTVDCRFLGLAMLPHLRRVTLQEVNPADQITCSVLNDLEDAMITKRWDVSFGLYMSNNLEIHPIDQWMLTSIQCAEHRRATTQSIDEIIQDLRFVFDRYLVGSL